MARTRQTARTKKPPGKQPRPEALRRVLGNDANENLLFPSSSGGVASSSSSSGGASSSSSSSSGDASSSSSSSSSHKVRNKRSRSDMENENESRIYRENIPDELFQYGDIRKVNPDKVRSVKPPSRLFHSKITTVECETKTAPLTVCICLFV